MNSPLALKSSQLSISSVEVWLENLPNSEHTNDNNHHHHNNNNNKRRRSDSVDTTSPHKTRRLRKPFSAMNANQQPPRRSARKIPPSSQQEDCHDATPRKARTLRPEHEDEEEATPRKLMATRPAELLDHQLKTVRAGGLTDNTRFTLPPAPAFSQRTGAEPGSPTKSESSIRSSSTASAPSRGSRASSPGKKPYHLRFAQWPVDFDPPAELEIPMDIVGLEQQLEAVNDGQRIVPYEVESLISQVLAKRRQTVMARHLDTPCQRPFDDLRREFQEILEVVDSTSRMKNLSFAEPAWNDEVHSRLFRTALSPLPDVRAFNVTTVRPCAQYLPVHHSSGTTMDSKLVDYTINLMPDTSMKYSIEGLLNTVQDPSAQSMTQTLYEPTLICPAAISIETKSDQGTARDAKKQLGIWVATHFAKLRSLLQARYGDAAYKMKIPAHPLISWNTNVMAVLYAVQSETEGRIWVFRGHEIPVPNTVLEGYKTLKALRCLAEWANGSFRRWVHEVLLRPFE